MLSLKKLTEKTFASRRPLIGAWGTYLGYSHLRLLREIQSRLPVENKIKFCYAVISSGARELKDEKYKESFMKKLYHEQSLIAAVASLEEATSNVLSTLPADDAKKIISEALKSSLVDPETLREIHEEIIKSEGRSV